MRRLTTMILAAALLAPASGLAMQKMRTNNNKSARVTKKTQQKKAPLVTTVRVTVVPLSAALTGSRLNLAPSALSSVAQGLEKSAAGAEVAGKAPTRVQATSLAKRSNKQVADAEQAERDAARLAQAQRQRAWAD